MVMLGSAAAEIHIDGGLPISADMVGDLAALCDQAEDRAEGFVVVHVSGTPAAGWAEGLTVGLVSKWERALRRLERLPVGTVAIASGDCGGAALDALLVTDYRVVLGGVRLMPVSEAGATWPGMAVHRLPRQVGSARIRKAVLFGTPLSADEAVSMQLIDERAESVADARARAAAVMHAIPGSELAIRRQLMLNATTTSFEDALGAHLAACDRMLRRLARDEAL